MHFGDCKKKSVYEHLYPAFCVSLFWSMHLGIAGSSCNSVFSVFLYSQSDFETTFTISHSTSGKDGGFTCLHPRPRLLLSVLLVAGRRPRGCETVVSQAAPP